MFFETLEARQLLSFGSIDTTFGNQGSVAAASHDTGVGTERILIESDGSIVTAGTAGQSEEAWAFRRYLADGSVDTSFGDNGYVTLQRPLSSAAFSINFLAQAPDGGIFFAGSGAADNALDQSSNKAATMLLGKLNADGSLDQTFPSGGESNVGVPGLFRIDTAGPASSDPLDWIQQDANGKLLIATRTDGENAVALRRFNADGSLDKTFGTKGKATIDLGVPTDQITVPGAGTFTTRRPVGMTLAELSDGSIVIGGGYIYAAGTEQPQDHVPYTSTTLPIFIKVSASGQLVSRKVYEFDPSKVKNHVYHGVNIESNSLDVGPDGKLYLLGNSTIGRFDSSTFALDTSFGSGGIASPIVHSPDGSFSNFAPTFSAFRIQSDGKILGVAPHAGDQSVLLRMNTDGSVDQFITLASQPSDLQLDADGTILVAGGLLPLTRFFRDDGPAGRFEGGTLKSAVAAPYKFSVVWRDEDGVNIDSLDNNDLQIVAPDGNKFSARLISKTLESDGSVFARYRFGPPNGIQWNSVSNGRYSVRVLSNHVSDSKGNGVTGRSIGAFNVRLPT